MYNKLSCFEEPSYNSRCTVIWYDNDRKADIITRKNENADFLRKYRRVSANEYFNPKTGKVEKYNRKRTKNQASAFKCLKVANQLCLNNFEGNETEKLIKAFVNKKMKDTHQVTKILNDFLDNLKKEIKPVTYIKVLLYNRVHYPICHFWLKTKDNSKLEISQELLEKLWKEHGIVMQIDLTEANREEMAKYYQDYETKRYPHNIHILSYSKDIKHLRKEYLTRAELKEKLKGFAPKYQSTTVQVEKVNGKEIELQRTSYETYIKVKDIQTLKLDKNTIHKRYKGIIIKGIYACQQEEKRKIELEINQKFQKAKAFLEQYDSNDYIEIVKTNNINEFNLINKNTGEILPLKDKSIDNILFVLEESKPSLEK